MARLPLDTAGLCTADLDGVMSTYGSQLVSRGSSAVHTGGW